MNTIYHRKTLKLFIHAQSILVCIIMPYRLINTDLFLPDQPETILIKQVFDSTNSMNIVLYCQTLAVMLKCTLSAESQQFGVKIRDNNIRGWFKDPAPCL